MLYEWWQGGTSTSKMRRVLISDPARSSAAGNAATDSFRVSATTWGSDFTEINTFLFQQSACMKRTNGGRLSNHDPLCCT